MSSFLKSLSLINSWKKTIQLKEITIDIHQILHLEHYKLRIINKDLEILSISLTDYNVFLCKNPRNYLFIKTHLSHSFPELKDTYLKYGCDQASSPFFSYLLASIISSSNVLPYIFLSNIDIPFKYYQPESYWRDILIMDTSLNYHTLYVRLEKIIASYRLQLSK